MRRRIDEVRKKLNDKLVKELVDFAAVAA